MPHVTIHKNQKEICKNLKLCAPYMAQSRVKKLSIHCVKTLPIQKTVRKCCTCTNYHRIM